MSFRKFSLATIIIFTLIFPLRLPSQEIPRSLIDRLKEEQLKEEEKEKEKAKIEDEELAKPEKPESLSYIEKVFKENYFITREKMQIKKEIDSLEDYVREESLMIEIRGEITLEDTLYLDARKRLSDLRENYDTMVVELKQFGYRMLRVTLTEMPSFAPVSDDYILGPGDELEVSISGKINESWTETVNREGKIVIPQIGGISVWGKTYRESEKTITDRLKKEFSNIEVNVSIGDLRSVSVFILGEVNNPGLYNINSLSNPLSAIYTAGGAKKSGSLRKIRYIPKSGNTVVYDLYNLLVKGEKPENIQLESGDIIYIPPIGKIAGITGAVTRPAIYEIEESEDLYDIINMSGGMLPIGGNYRIQVERVEEGTRKTVTDFTFTGERDFNNKIRRINIRNGDLVQVFKIPPLRHNYVRIEGNVVKPGAYGLKDGMKIKDLIESAGGLKTGTYMERAEILRYAGVRNPEIIKVDLEDMMKDKEKDNIELREWDKVRVYSKEEMEENLMVTISGAVKKSGEYPLNPDMTVGDLLFRGVPLREAKEEGELFRVDPDKGVSLLVINIEDSSDLKTELRPNDHILIKKKPAYRDVGYIELEGEFVYPGIYPIKIGEPLRNVIERAGGFTEDAYLDGAVFTRESVEELQNESISDLIRETRMRIISEQRQIMESTAPEEEKTAQMRYLTNQQQQIAQLSQTRTPGRVVIDLDDPRQTDMPLEDGDKLSVPTLPKTVQIVGQVYNPTGVTYENGLTLDDYLRMSGGPKPTADKEAIYVRRASGKVVKNPEEMKPGDTIIVPEKVEIGKSLWEVFSQLATILYQIGVAAAAIYSVLPKD